ncbi:ricin-type beta-trefoil lectin domain protein [Streptomyces sp. DT24]|uniref:ricin-type beta-trefoil lectin domain protein n=1 Tax=unclassified Streptomyces TaxID=2593676 RepID=UPI003CE8445F
MRRTRHRIAGLRRTVATVAATAAALGGMAVAAGPAGAAGARTTATASTTPTTAPLSTPLPPALEAVRAAEATALYGSPAERPLAERRTGLISLGDSEISGEGVGSYETGTNGPVNWCHRSPDSAIHRTGIAADVTYNVACSGAYTGNIRIGGTKQYADELVQSDSLAVKARNTRIKMIVLVAGANDDLQFGPVMTDCVERWFLLQGGCESKYDGGWQARVDALVPKVEQTVRDLRTVMTDAGYAAGDYKLVVMGYPSPIGPDFNDNPKFPGKLPGGCAGYDSDAAWGRNTAVPAFERGMRRAAAETGAVYLDNSRLFHGHEVCSENTWARGLHIDLANPFPPDANSVRQSFHPNVRGHAAFASCLTQIYRATVREAGCADPAGTGSPVLTPVAWDDVFAPLRNEATGSCLDVPASVTRNGTRPTGWDCHGGRNQSWWYDAGSETLRTALSHARCLDVSGADYRAGAALILWDCSGAANQKFVRQAGTLRPAAATGLCVTLAGAKDQLKLGTCAGSAGQRFA